MNGKILALVAILVAGAAAATSSSKKPGPSKFVPFAAHQRPGYWVHPELADAEVWDEVAAMQALSTWAQILPQYLPPKDLADLATIEVYGIATKAKTDPWLLPNLDKLTGGALWRLWASALRFLVAAGKMTQADAIAEYKARQDQRKLLGFEALGPVELFA